MRKNLIGAIFFLATGQLWAQFVSVGAGAIISQGRSAPSSVSSVTNAITSADFSKAGIVTVDGGVPVFPFMTAGLHYSFARPELSLNRGDALKSFGQASLSENTLTLEGRVHTPSVLKWQVFGLAGVGLTHFSTKITAQIANPFPNGAPSVTAPVFTIGGGVRHKIAGPVSAKFELRDYISPLSQQFYQPGGAWNRVAATVGVVLGK